MIVRRRAPHDSLNCRRHRLGFPKARESLIGMYHQHTIVIGTIKQFDQRVFGAKMNGFDGRNFHATLSTLRLTDRLSDRMIIKRPDATR